MYRNIQHCRISNSNSLTTVLDLGNQYLSGIFPSSRDQKVEKSPLELVFCNDSGLLQLRHTYSLSEMYGENYGYRSGLNQSMVNHLNNKIKSLERMVKINKSDLIIDIGSNDATSLKAYSNDALKIGIDPTAGKFKQYYTDDIELIEDFFPTDSLSLLSNNKKAKIITSLAMFYDLEDPISFANAIKENLDADGIWHFEQSYMPSMLRSNAYDTICHEHLEYYSLKNILYILKEVDLKIVDVQLNDINGGSFAITATHLNSKKYLCNNSYIDWLLSQEEKMKINSLEPFLEFKQRVEEHKDSLRDLIHRLRSDGKTIFGYGASTKGNVLLQYCNFSADDIEFIAEVNEEKFGCFTPGTKIPIISESEAKKMQPDYFLVLPWHFRNSIISRENEFLLKGGNFIFPLPFIQIY